MGSHIITDTKSIKTFQFNLKSKVIAAILNCKMKTFTISSFVFLMVAIAFVAKASGKPSEIQCSVPAKTDIIDECWTWFGTSGIAEVVACCKGKGVPEDCIKHCEEKQPAK